jgi:translation initiation factor RLI1
MSKTIGNFKLTVMEGEFTDSQIFVMLGENGTGKTTFIKMLVHLSLTLSSTSHLSVTLMSSSTSNDTNRYFAL